MLQVILKGSVPSASIAHARKFLSTVPEVRVLEATRRVESGSRVSRKARAQGLVPSVLYGPGPSGKQESVMIYLRQYDIKSELRHMKAAFENTIYKLVVDGEEFRVLPKQLTMHPMFDEVTRVNFCQYSEGKLPGKKVQVPIKGIHEERCIALKDGGWLQPVWWKVPCRAVGSVLPPAVYADLRGKRIGDKIWADDLIVGDGLVLDNKVRGTVIAKLAGSRRMMSAATAT